MANGRLKKFFDHVANIEGCSLRMRPHGVQFIRCAFKFDARYDVVRAACLYGKITTAEK